MSHDELPTADCGPALERIERALDVGISAAEQTLLQQHLVGCSFCADAQRDAAVVHRMFRETGAPHCPDHVVDAILAQVETPVPAVQRIRSPRPGRRYGSWMAAGVAVALLILAILPARTDSPVSTVEPAPTFAEIQTAAAELRIAMDLVSRSMSRTTEILDAQVRGHVATPVRRGLERGGIHPSAPTTSATTANKDGIG